MNETGFVADLLIHHLALSTGLIIAVSLALALSRYDSAAARHASWALVLVMLLAMPLLLAWPDSDWEVRSSTPTTERMVATPPGESTAKVAARTDSGSIPTPATRPTATQAGSLGRWLAAAWLLGALLQLTLLLRALRYNRDLRRRSAWAPNDLVQKANTLARRMGMSRTVTVRLSSEVGSPQTVGTLAPMIVLPTAWQTQASSSMVSHALTHELAHIKRGDHWWVWLQFGARVAFSFNPGIWYVISQMNTEREAACDDWALSLGASPQRYASSLLSVAASLLPGRPPELAIPCLRSKNHLRRRISHMLDVKKSHSTLRAGRLTAAAAAIVFAGAALAAPQWVNLGISAREAVGAAVSLNVSRDRTPRADDGLLFTAWAGDLAATRQLLAGGADPEQVNGRRDPRTPLVAAARRGHWDVMFALLDAGARVDFHHHKDESALIAASGRAPAAVITELLARGADAGQQMNGDGTPLIAAARHGQAANVELLLAAGADPNTWSNGDESALFHAAVGGHVEIVELLLDAGVDPSVTFDGDGTPLMLAIRHGHDDVANLLLKAGASVNEAVSGDGTALIDAARRNDVATASALLAAGADVNQAVRGDGNALINAARGGHLELAALLMDAGAGVNAHVEGDDTPLINAVWSNNAALVGLLLERGADPLLEGDYDRELRTQRTPLNQAAPGSQIAMLLTDAAGGNRR
ncbi:MAG: ankyrin repeat domain-containing protein [Pseudomonadota bacterium]